VVEINDLVQFRAEIDLKNINTEFCLESELHFCDLSQLGGPSGWKKNY